MPRPVDNSVLVSELENDPLERGYAAMTDQQIVADLTTRNRSKARTIVTGVQIFNAIVPSEFDALSTSEEQRVRDVWQFAEIDIAQGTGANQILFDAFDERTATRTALQALMTENVSRADELGLIGLELKHVRMARVGRN